MNDWNSRFGWIDTVSKDDIEQKMSKGMKKSTNTIRYTAHAGNTFTTEEISDIQKFLFHNYVSAGNLRLHYSTHLLQYFFNHSIVLQFFSNDKCVGMIAGKCAQVYYDNNKVNCLEINFLALHPNIRNIGLSNYMKYALGQEAAIHFKNEDIQFCLFTTENQLDNCPSYGKKQMFLRPVLNVPGSKQAKYNSSNPTELTQTYNRYCNTNYSIFQCIDMQDMVSNPAFHTFEISEHDIVVLYRIDVQNNSTTIRQGHICVICVSNHHNSHLSQVFDAVISCCKANDIVDIVSINDSFQESAENFGFFPSGSFLHYYALNKKIDHIENYKNGLVTL